MSIAIADNFQYLGNKPLDTRTKFGSVDAMAAYDETALYDGCIAYVANTKTYYSFDSSNDDDPTTGKWREFKGGGGNTGLIYSSYTNWAKWLELVNEVDTSGMIFTANVIYETNEPVENIVDTSKLVVTSSTLYTTNDPVETESNTSEMSITSSVVLVVEE